MEVLSSRILLRPSDPVRSQTFYRDVLGLAVYREFGLPERRGVVFFLETGCWRSPVSPRSHRWAWRYGCRYGTSPLNTIALRPPA